MANAMDSTTLNKISMFSYIHGKADDMSRAYMHSLDHTPRYKDSTFDYRVYLTKSMGMNTTLDHSLFSLEFLYKNKIDSILNDSFKLNFLYDQNRSISGTYKDLESVRSMNSIGIFDLSTCFYTTNYTKELPFTSTFNNEKITEFLNSKTFSDSKESLNEIIDVEKIYKDMSNNEWKDVFFNNKEKIYGDMIFFYSNKDKSYFITFNQNGSFKSYYLDYSAYNDYNIKALNYSDIKMTKIKIDNYENIKFIDVNDNIKDHENEKIALISVNLESPELYYSKDNINWIKFTDVDKNNKPISKLYDIFNPECTEKLTNIWDYKKVTRKNISVLNMFKFDIDVDKILYIAQIVEKESDNLTAKVLSDKTILMYSDDGKTWNPCNISKEMYMSPIFDYKYSSGLRFICINHNFYIYNNSNIDPIKSGDEKTYISVISSQNGIDWISHFENNFIAYSVEGNINNDVITTARLNYYEEKECNYRDYAADHTSTVKVYHQDYYFEIKSGTSGGENSIVAEKIVENYTDFKVFKLKDDVYIIYNNPDKTYTISKLISNHIFEKVIENVTCYVISKEKLFYMISTDKSSIYSTSDLNSEEKNISTISTDFLYQVNNIETIQKDNDTDFIVINLTNSTLDSSIWYAKNTKDSTGSLKFEELELRSNYDFFIKKGNYIFASNSNTNFINIIYSNIFDNIDENNVNDGHELYCQSVFIPEKDQDLLMIERIKDISISYHYSDKNNGDYQAISDIEIIAISDNNILIFDYGKKSLRVIKNGIDTCNFDGYYIGSYKISDKFVDYGTDKQLISNIYDKQLQSFGVINNKLFAFGDHVYYCDLNNYTIKDTGHTAKDYRINQISDLVDNPLYGIFWDKMTKYCLSDNFVTYIGEDPKEYKSLKDKRENDHPDFNNVEFYKDHKIVDRTKFKYNDFYQVISVINYKTETTKELQEINNLTKFEDGIEYYTKDSEGNINEVDTSIITEPELVDEEYTEDINKIKVDINLSNDTTPDLNKTYYKLIEHKPGELKEFTFGQEYYTKVDDKFELYDTATNETPDNSITYYTFELFEGDNFELNSTYYTFDASTYTETVKKIRKVSKVYYTYVDKETVILETYITKDGINYYKLDMSIDYSSVHYIFCIKDKVFVINKNDIYAVSFDYEKIIAKVDPILGYFNNGKMLVKTDSEYHADNMRINNLTDKISINYTNGNTSNIILTLGYDKDDYNSGEYILDNIHPKDKGWQIVILDEDNVIEYPKIWNESVESNYKLQNTSIFSSKVLRSEEVKKFLDEVSGKYLRYYQFNKLLDKEYVNIIHDFENKFKKSAKDYLTFYDFITKFGITSDKYDAKKVVDLYNCIVKMQKFIAFVISAQETIANSIKVYKELKEGSKYELYFKNINYIPHMYNILWSIVDTRLSKLNSIEDNTPIYEYFSEKLIKDNTNSIFRTKMILEPYILDPINESASTGKTGDTNYNLDKVYSILTQNYDKTMVMIENFDPDRDSGLDIEGFKKNKYFIKYLYMAVVTLQIFNVISSVSSINKKFDTINFDTVMKVLGIDYSKNYSDDEVYEDVIKDLNNINF